MEEKKVIKVLREYASSLNTAQTDKIPAFYTEDGQFMPDGFKTFTMGAPFLKRAGNFLKRKNFNIEYRVENLIIDEGYAFVLTTAQTSTIDVVSGHVSEKTSRDFFVLRKEGDDWKIYRYMFNNSITLSS